MPIYEYRCEKCGEAFSRLQKMGGEATDCPKCGSADVKRQISACAIGAGGSAPSGPACGMGGG